MGSICAAAAAMMDLVCGGGKGPSSNLNADTHDQLTDWISAPCQRFEKHKIAPYILPVLSRRSRSEGFPILVGEFARVCELERCEHGAWVPTPILASIVDKNRSAQQPAPTKAAFAPF